MSTIGELLSLPELLEAEVLAGGDHLGRQLSFVGVHDPLTLGQLTLPGELVLTTWDRGLAADGANLLSMLGERSAAGLFIRSGFGTPDRKLGLGAIGDSVSLPVIQLPNALSWERLTGSIMSRLAPPQGDTTDMFEQMTEVLLTGGGIEAILERLSSLSGCPVLYLSRHFEPLSVYPQGSVDAKDIARQLQRLLRYSDVTFTGKYLELADAFDCCVSSVTAGSMRYGYVAILGTGGPLTKRQQATAQQGATTLALHFLKSDAIASVERIYHESFVGDLLLGRVSPAEAAVRAGRVGLTLADEYVVLLFVPEEGGSNRLDEMEQLRNGITQALRSISLNCARASLSDSHAILLPAAAVGNNAYSTAESLRDLTARLPGFARVSVGVGRVVRLEELPQGLDEAMTAAHLGHRLRGPGVHAYDTIGSYHFLDSVCSEAETSRFFNQILGGVISTCSKKEASELLGTLATYFEVHRSRNECAKRMYMHPNTIGYRLHKFERLTGLSLDRADHAFDVQLALRLGEVLGARSYRPGVARRGHDLVRTPKAVRA